MREAKEEARIQIKDLILEFSRVFVLAFTKVKWIYSSCKQNKSRFNRGELWLYPIKPFSVNGFGT